VNNDTSEQLGTHPHIGRVGRVERTRELVIPKLPYIVAYTITAEDIRILAVVHTSRKWPESFRQNKRYPRVMTPTLLSA
jgi:plasmid stabilization system protein ParE